MLTKEELGQAAVKAGDIDTVVVAFTDMQGRLMGKRLEAHFFLEEMAAHNPIEGCNYLLAVDMDMDPVPGYAMANWESGYGDFDMIPDFSMMAAPASHGSRAPRWSSAMLAWHDRTPVKRPSPRQVLKAQVERAQVRCGASSRCSVRSSSST